MNYENKMALKDWKKIPKGYWDAIDKWKDKKTNKILYIEKYTEDKKTFYYVTILFTNIEKAFKKRTQALKFAKNYMGKH